MGQTTLLHRDEFGQVVEEVDAAGNSRYQEYNDAGQMVRATDCSGRITRYRYHPLGWLVAETGADGEETRYRYDAAGRPVQLDRPEGWTESLAWNERGLPVKHAGADGKESEFRYDDAGRLTATRNTQGKRCAAAGTAAGVWLPGKRKRRSVPVPLGRGLAASGRDRA